jgi:hypothetical protein
MFSETKERKSREEKKIKRGFSVLSTHHSS